MHFRKKTIVLSIICSKCKNEDQEIFKEEESIETLKFLGLIEKYIITSKIWVKNLAWKI